MHFFPPPIPPNPSLRKIQKLWGSGTQPCNLNLQLPPTDVAVSGNKLQASHHILYVTQLYWAREGLLGTDCDTVISKREMPSHLTSSCMISSQGAWVPKVTGILISPWITWVGGGTVSLNTCQQEMHVVHGASQEPLCSTGWKKTQKALLEVPPKPCN